MDRFFFSVGSIGAIIAPILAGFIADWHLAKTIFLVSIVFMILSILLLVLIPEKKKSKTKIKLRDLNPLYEISDFLKYRRLQGMAILGMTMNAKGQIITIFFPIFVVKTLGLPVYWFGILWGIGPFIHMFQFYFGRIADSISAQFGVMLGVFIVCISMLFMPLATGITSLAIILFVYGLGSSIWNVTAWSLMSSVAEKHDMEGEVVGTYYSLSYFAMFLASLFGAYIVDAIGIARTLQTFAVVILCMTVVSYFFFRPIFHNVVSKN
ncbi:MAG: MFS transporter [Candidatus Woesearchaeota archaeon]|nr:MFS transporter [Candidatus Woesearchaeota archaeon]